LLKTILVIFVLLFTGVAGPPLIKVGAMKESARITTLIKGDMLSGLYILMNPYILFGLFMYFVSAMLWIIILSKYELSFVNPLLSINYVFSLFIGYYFFHEGINLYRILGAVIITIGVALITTKG
jgi:drug/metabolite transporter (DMT)-like permease